MSVPPEGINLREVIASFERRIIESTLDATGGVQKDAARLLGLKPTTLNEMIKRHSIPLARDRDRRLVPGREETAAPGASRALCASFARGNNGTEDSDDLPRGASRPRTPGASLTSDAGIGSLALIGGNYRT